MTLKIKKVGMKNPKTKVLGFASRAASPVGTVRRNNGEASSIGVPLFILNTD